jgi:hypothetical protein
VRRLHFKNGRCLHNVNNIIRPKPCRTTQIAEYVLCVGLVMA